MIYLSSLEAVKILKDIKSGKESINFSPDLGRTFETLKVRNNSIYLDNIEVPSEILKKLSNIRDRIFIFRDGKFEPVEYSGKNYVKLTPTEWGIPTIQISGIKMHRTVNIDPWKDTKNKVKGMIKKGSKVLDTCTGLGYTAIEARNSGASLLVSIEKSIEVHEICKLNPWSKEFFEDEKIYKIIGNSVEQVKLFKDNFFDAVIHDPPRFSIAGDMYSEEFYLNLARILKKNGKLFHYIGKPDSKFGIKMFKSVKKRLEKCGFSVKIENERYGISGKINKR